MITITTVYGRSNGDRWQMLHDDETGHYVAPTSRTWHPAGSDE
jgi:hypothetical protein